MYLFLKKGILFLETYKDVISSIGTIITMLIAIYTIFFTNIPNEIVAALNDEIKLKKEEISKLNKEKVYLEIEILKNNDKLNILQGTIEKQDKNISELITKKENIFKELDVLKSEKYNKVLKSYIIFLKNELKILKYNALAFENYQKTLNFINMEENKFTDGLNVSIINKIKSNNGVYINNEKEIIFNITKAINEKMSNSYDNLECTTSDNKNCEERKVNIKLSYLTTVESLLKKKYYISFGEFLNQSAIKYKNNNNEDSLILIEQEIIKAMDIKDLSILIGDTTNLNKKDISKIINTGIILGKNIKKVDLILDQLELKLQKN